MPNQRYTIKHPQVRPADPVPDGPFRFAAPGGRFAMGRHPAETVASARVRRSDFSLAVTDPPAIWTLLASREASRRRSAVRATKFGARRTRRLLRRQGRA